jgi:hypothetical protein
MQQNWDGARSPEEHSALLAKASYRQFLHRPELRRLVRELEEIFTAFHRLLRKPDRDEEPDPIRIQLGALKRAVSERLPMMFQQVGPILVELEFWQPGIVSAFSEIWLDPPNPIQGPTTWLQYLGRLRQFLVELIGPEKDGTTDDDLDRKVRIPAPRRAPSVSERNETDRHFTAKQLAELWGLDQSTVRRIFRDEDGVLRIPHLRRHGKRDYVSLRIPASVAARMHKRRSRSLFKV